MIQLLLHILRIRDTGSAFLEGNRVFSHMLLIEMKKPTLVVVLLHVTELPTLFFKKKTISYIYYFKIANVYFKIIGFLCKLNLNHSFEKKSQGFT